MKARLLTGKHYEGKGVYQINCPACGTHLIPTIPSDWTTGVWGFNGNLESPTFTPSLNVRWGDPNIGQYVRICHSFITEGNISFCGDSTHELSGQTVPLNEIK